MKQNLIIFVGWDAFIHILDKICGPSLILVKIVPRYCLVALYYTSMPIRKDFFPEKIVPSGVRIHSLRV